MRVALAPLILSLALGASALTLAVAHEDHQAAAKPKPGEATFVIVRGLEHPDAADALQRALTTVDGVQAVAVDVQTRRVTVHYDPRTTGLARLARTIHTARQGEQRFVARLAKPVVQGEAALHLEGLHCQGCAAGLVGFLSRADGVKFAMVSFEASQAFVEYDPKITNRDRLIEAVNTTGFTAKHPDFTHPEAGANVPAGHTHDHGDGHQHGDGDHPGQPPQ